jgi:hypothetical protein
VIIICKVQEIKSQNKFAEKSITMVTVGDVLYSVDIPDDKTMEHEGQKVLTLDGMRYLVHQVRLVLEYEASDF